MNAKNICISLFLGYVLFVHSLRIDDGLLSNFNENRLEYFEKAKKYFKEKSYKKAVQNFRRFIKEQPYVYEVRDALFFLGESLAQEKKYFNAVVAFDSLSKKYPTSRYRKEVLFKKGECYFKLSITGRSEKYLKLYLKKVSQIDLLKYNHIDSFRYLGIIFENRRNYKKSIENLQRALEILGKKKKKYGESKGMELRYQDIHYRLGLIYAKHFKKKEIAYYYLKKYIKSKKDIPKSLKFIFRGLTLFHLGIGDGLPDKAISDIQVDGDDIWVSTWGHGVVRFSRSAESFVSIPLPSRQVRNMYVDFDNVYFATYDGIFIYDKSSGKVSPIQVGEKIFSLAQKVIKDDRYLYFSTLITGVVKFDTIQKKISIFDKDSFLRSNQVYCISADSKYLVFGTLDRGVIILNKKENKAVYIDETYLGSNNIKSVLIDGRFLWIGVHTKGVFRFDLKLRKIKKMDWDIPYPSIIQKRESEIWVGSSGNGLFIYDQRKDTLETLTAVDGLASNEIHLIEMEDNYTWIGYLDSGIDLFYRP